MADAERREHPRLSLHDRARRAAASGRVIPYLAASIAVLAVATGFISTLVDRRDFPTFGDGIWWAIVTLGTVGYGDIVPHTGWGRLLGSIVIVFGVTFISLLFATVTSYLVASDQQLDAGVGKTERAGEDEEARTLLREIASRLTAIECQLASMKRPD
jgi:voltage-gated potassium channel